MYIRPFVPSDASDLARIFHVAVHAIPDQHYTVAQRRAWSAKPVSSQHFLARVSDGRWVFVAQNAQTPIGFIELEANGHIDCFYCHPDFASRGVGTALYHHLEQVAISRGIPALSVDASVVAKPFFLKQGFRLDKQNTIERDGVILSNYTLSKILG